MLSDAYSIEHAHHHDFPKNLDVTPMFGDTGRCEAVGWLASQAHSTSSKP